MKILSVNCGSSSLKFQVYEMPEEKVLISGYVEKIGLEDCFWNVKVNGQKIRSERFLKDHTEAVQVLIEELFKHNIVKSMDEIKGIGHRVVHGAEKYAESVIIDDDVLSVVEENTKLAPLHHPGNLAGIAAMKKELPDVPMVAVFDTAFHQTMPKKNYIYPVPMEWYEKYGVRKYGFHGTSHKYITEVMQEKLGKEDVNLIICHIGSGASITAVKDGKSYDTTMGLTALDGLMMGTRSGSIDPSIVEYMTKETGKGITEIMNDLNKKSGLLGISEFSDCRDVEDGVLAGDEKSKLALDMYADRIAKYIGQYYIELEGNIDGIVFTAGAGENSAIVRKYAIQRLECLGIKLDEAFNEDVASFRRFQQGIISDDNSKVPVYVIPTNEELMIVRDTYNINQKTKRKSL